MVSDTLKEYYIKLEKMWADGLNVLNAINQSLKTNAEDIEVTLAATSNSSSGVKYRIPSFLYLENKLETLTNNFENLFHLPDNGEAWLTSDDNTNSFKVQLIRSGVSPVSPIIDTNETLFASITDNNILKDMVSPKTYLRLNISNLPENIDKVLMRKYIINNYSVYDALKNASTLSDFDIATQLFSLRRGVDYDVYENAIDLPIKQNRFNAQFRIEEVVGLPTIADKKYTYTVQLNTLKYTDVNDPSIEYTLTTGQKLCLGNKSVVFRINKVDRNTNQVVLEEAVGHCALQTYYEDEHMVMGIYINDFSDFHYVQVPLEENPYICIMLATIQDNVQSVMSKPVFINLNETIMTDANGQVMYDENMNKMTYMQYYEKYCTNIGDLILGLTEASYMQLSNLTNYQLEALQTDVSIKALVDGTIDNSTILKVLPINKHILDTTTTEELISMHAQKNELMSQLNSINNNIADVNNQLSTTDFSQEVAVTQQSLRSQLSGYYADRILLQKQLVSVVENINTNVGQLQGKDIKYRIRGIANTVALEEYIHKTFSEKLDIIGIDVEYKYKALNKDTTTLTSINSNVFTDWNKLVSIDKERLVQSNGYGGFNIVFENYSSTNNIIKWNQIDIPITANEDVVVRVRYKYSIGQPFISLYSPWSDEVTVVFPVEYKDNVEVNAIITENQNDVISAKFNATLINDGYADHITNAVRSQDVTFYHTPENIYSGFNTSENVMISLKDKLQEMSQQIKQYEALISTELNSKYKIFLVYDNQQIELLPNITNTLTVYNADHIVNSFVKKNMSIIVKNVGDVPVRMYSIFPGNVSIPLLFNDDTFYERIIGNYERVPLVVNENIEHQRLGQWIYFRQNNPWTGKDIYYNNDTQNRADWHATDPTNREVGCVWSSVDTSVLMKRDFSQVLCGWRKRNAKVDYVPTTAWKGMKYDNITRTFTKLISDDIAYDSNEDSIKQKYLGIDDTFFMFNNIGNNYLVRYEDIYYDDNGTRYYLDKESSLSEFVAQHNVPGNFNDDIDFTGAFLYPELDSLTQVLTSGGIADYTEIPVGGSINVPVALEFYLNEDLTSVVKGLYFDIKPSSYTNPIHYMVEVTALYDYTASGNLLGNISLIDETID